MNEIICGNCVDVMKTMPDNYIDLTVTSPPYDNLRDYNGYDFDFKRIAKQLYRITKDGGVVVWVVGDATVDGSETGTSFRQALHFKEMGFNLHDTMIYEKNNFAFPDHSRYHQTFEYVFVLSKGKLLTFNPIYDKPNLYIGQKSHGKNRAKRESKYIQGGQTKNEYGKRHNVWRYVTGGGHVTTDKIAYNHPAIFPEKLANDHIISWSNEGDLVLDPMCGSGTTCKMAMINNRNYIGIDISEEYCEIARRRIAETEMQASIC